MCNPLSVTFKVALMLKTLKTRDVLLPLMVNVPVPVHSIVKSLFISRCPLVNVIVWFARLASKVIVSPLDAAAIASRNVPAPLLALEVTVIVSADTGRGFQGRLTITITRMSSRRRNEERWLVSVV
jgi:hypothetical protein